MEHTKKMILVETRQIEKLKESMLDKTLSKLDGEIYDILHRNIADDEKAKLYSNSLSRYLNIDKPSVVTTTFKSEDAVASTSAAAAAATAPDSEKASESVKDSKNVESLVLETVPKKWKSQASRLLTHIKNNPDVTWSEKGELVLKNTTIPKTHAVDLVNDLLRKRTSTSSPSGWKQLANALKDDNIPHELIGNEDRWKYINSSHNESFAVGPNRRQRKRQRLDWEPY